MREAILVCSDCGAVAGNAHCPKCGSVLEYAGPDSANCPNKRCGTTGWAPVNLKFKCPNCGSWYGHFRPS